MTSADHRLFRDFVSPPDRKDNLVCIYNLEYLYPQTIEAQDLAFDAFDTISEFNVVWNYHYFTTVNPSSFLENEDDLLQ